MEDVVVEGVKDGVVEGVKDGVLDVVVVVGEVDVADETAPITQ